MKEHANRFNKPMPETQLSRPYSSTLCGFPFVESQVVAESRGTAGGAAGAANIDRQLCKTNRNC
ncbi:MAG: hypothetical protein MHMPM18_000655 [Marteilia pararefringens]